MASWLFVEVLETRILLTAVSTVSPAPNSHTAPVSTDISATFDQNINAATVTPRTLVLHSMEHGQLMGSRATASTTGATIELDPMLDFFPGELVQASVTSSIQSVSSQPATPRVWQFRTGVHSGSGRLADSGQRLGSDHQAEVALGDLDGDGDLDIFLTRYRNQSIWLNNNGVFAESGQTFGTAAHNVSDVSLGDLDGDGDLDAFVASGGSNRVWTNDGNGNFSDSGQRLGNDESGHLDLGDVDGDGDLDALDSGGTHNIWLNGGNGAFTNSGQSLGIGLGRVDGVSLGDLDSDGDLDFFVAYEDEPDQVWLNSGDGTFTNSGQYIMIAFNLRSSDVDLGDLDGDGDLDAFIAVGAPGISSAQPELVLLNDGSGVFSDSGQRLGQSRAGKTTLGDLDGDGDLDALVQHWPDPSKVWLNDGGEFSDSGQNLDELPKLRAALGDLDGDGDLDVVATISNTQEGSNGIWLNQNATLQVASLLPTATGFVAEFNQDLDTDSLSLYDAQTAGRGPADVTLQGAASGSVQGSLIVDASLRKVTFLKTGDPLQADRYTVILRSAADGFKTVAGSLLDGDGDGVAVDDFVYSFSVAASQANTITLSLPDLVRGPGQDVDLPVNENTGIPLSISEGTEVRTIDLQISYDPALLEITSARVAENMPAGASVIVNTNTPGLLIVVFFSATALPAGSSTFVNLQASVPATDASGIYGKQQVLDIHSVTISDGNDNEFPVIANDAVHLASYLADVSGNLRINASDAAQVARVAALIDDGFVATPLTDPRIVGDISGNGRINAADASLVARFAALIDVPEIPPIPSAVAAGGAGAGSFSSLACRIAGKIHKSTTARPISKIGRPRLTVGTDSRITSARSTHSWKTGGSRLSSPVRRRLPWCLRRHSRSCSLA